MSERVSNEVSDARLIALLFDEFGVIRALQLIGWCALFGMAGVENLAEYREQLGASGLQRRAAVYNAIRDLRRFRERVEVEEAADLGDELAVAQRLSSMGPVDLGGIQVG